MKKLIKGIFLLTSLCLMSCGENNSSPISTNPPISDSTQKESSFPISGEEPISSEEQKSEVISSETEASSSEISSDSTSHESSSSEEVEDTDWSQDVKTKMTWYLNGQVLPFFSLGSNVIASYQGVDSNHTSPYLELKGTAIQTQERLAQANAALSLAGWTVIQETSSLTATLQSQSLALEFYEDATDQHAILHAMYLESYDSNYNTTGFWRGNVTTLFLDEMDGHSLPYFYMGTTTPYTTSASSNFGLTIRGNGTWQDEIETFADAAFDNDGYDVSSGTDPYFGTPYRKYTKQFDDACKIEVHLSHSSTYGALLEITFTKTLDPSVFTDWPQDIKNDFANYLDGHDLPLVFLNTANPTSYWSTSGKELDISGGTWDDGLETLAKTTLTQDNWHCVNDADDTYVFKNTNSILVATKTFTDDCTITIKMGEKYEASQGIGEALMIVTIEKAFVVPDDCTDWTDATKDTFTDTFNHVVPFVYLGEADPDVTVKSPYVTIKGTDAYNSQILDLATTAFTNAGWTNERQDFGSFGTYIGSKYLSGDGVVASYEYSDYTLTAYVGKDYSSTAYMIISYHETFNPSLYTDWSQNIQNQMTTNLHNHILPYVYLGASNPQSSWDSTSNKLTIVGEIYNSQVETLFNTAYADWNLTSFISSNFTFASNSKVSQASKTFADGCVFTIQVGEKYAGRSTGKAMMIILIEKPLTIPDDCTEWDSSTATSITTNIGENTIPYVYLNAKTTTAKWNSDDFKDYLDITGGSWNSAITTFFEDAFDQAQWNIDEDVTATSTSGFQTGSILKQASTTLEDGRELVAQVGEKFTNSGSGGSALLRIYVNTPYVCPEDVTDWDNNVKTAFDTYFNSHYLPFFYCNTTANFTVDSTYWNNLNEIDFYTNGKWTDEMVTAAKAAFQTDGDWNLSESVESFWGTKVLIANKDYTDGVHLKVKLYHAYDGPKMEVTRSQAFDPNSSTGAWSTATQDLINTYMGNKDIPYVYVGPNEDSYYSSYYYYIDILGSYWNNQIVNLFENAFDTDDWDIQEKGYAYGEPIRVAYSYDDNGNAWRVVLTKNYNGQIEIKMFYDEACIDPGTTTGWSESVQENLDQSLGSQYALPYIYLGVENPSSQAYSGSCMIKGEKTIWNDSLADNAEDVFRKNNWEVYTGNETYYYSKVVSAYKKEDDGTVLIAIFEYNYMYGTSLTYYKFTGYDVNQAPAGWSTRVEDIMDVNFEDKTIPYFYIGNDLTDSSHYTYYSATHQLELRGSPDVFSYEIYTQAEQALALDGGWDISYSVDSYYGMKKFTAVKNYDDGTSITITIEYDNLYGVKVTITYSK